MNSQHLQDQVAKELSLKMQSDIDFQILADVLVSFGWKRIDLSKSQDNNHAIDIGHWLKDNCKSRYVRQGRYFLFEDDRDATWFTLKWV